MDPQIQAIFERLGIKIDTTSSQFDRLSAATKEQVKSATAQALAQAKAYKDLLKSIEQQLAASGARTKASKAELEAIAKKIKQEEAAYDQRQASLQQEQKLDDERTEKTKKLIQDVKALGSSALSATSSFYASDKAFTAVTGTLDLVGNGLKAVTEAASLALSGISVMGFSVGRASEALGKLAVAGIETSVAVGKMMLEMTQSYVDNYNKITAVGVTFGGNLAELSRAAHTSGLDIRAYSNFIVQNIEILNELGGTIEQAATRIAKMGRAAIDGNNKLLVMYGGFEEVNSALAGYNRLLAQTGYDTVANQGAVTAGSKDYLEQLKQLSELTGKSVKQLQKEQEEAQKDVAFRLKLRDIERKGPEGLKEAAAIRENYSILLRTQGKEAADLYKEKVANEGMVISVSGNRYRAFNQAQDLLTTQINSTNKMEREARLRAVADFIKTSDAGIDAQLDNQRDIARIGMYAPSEVTKAIVDAMRSSLDTAEARKNFDKAVSEAIKNGKLPLDETGDDLASVLRKNMEGRIKIDETIVRNLKQTAANAEKLTELQIKLIDLFGDKFVGAVNKAIGALTDLANVGKPGGASSGGGPLGQLRNELKIPFQSAGRAMPGSFESKIKEKGATPSTPAIPIKPGTGDEGKSRGGPLGALEDLVTITSKAGPRTQVNKNFATQFQSLIDYLDSVGYQITSLGGYNNRDATSKPGQKSIHAYGAALDINPASNPYGNRLITDLPSDVAQVAASLGLGWGGNWSSVKDAMHFSAALSEGGKLLQAKTGGAYTGPESGYPAILHGTEAVVPLPNGRSIPVDLDMSELVNEVRTLVSIAKEQRNSLEDLSKAIR